MKLLFFLSLFSLLLQGETILVMNSNSDVKKYTEAVDAFSKNFNRPFKTLDISAMSSSEIKQSLYDEYPDIVYAVGAKAYQYANEYIPEKKIYFSSIVDWKKFPLHGKRYGVSNELHSGMQLTLIKTVLSTIKTIGVIHSKYTQNIVDDFSHDAKQLGIKILPIKIEEESLKNKSFDDTVKESDAMMIIPDPLFVNNATAIKNLFIVSEKYKKPVIAYHELFIKYGATLVISMDNPTVGRQIAAMIESHINEEKIEKIQYPAGTNIIFNKKEAALIGVKFSPDISSIATEIVE
ncbi:MAG: ABC transporter substrate-binding protein [Campylobacterales bacterium]|nr:ABC transporter substrate-binding protein [Campylobacterales bacterium]